MIHALKYTKDLEKVGFSSEQAKESVKIWMELMDANFTTKSDLKELDLSMQSEFKSVRSEINQLDLKMQSEFTSVRSEIKELDLRIQSQFKSVESEFKSVRSEIRELEYKLTAKLGGLLALGIGLIAYLIKF